LTGNWHLTWPTVYIAHQQLVASVEEVRFIDRGNGTAQVHVSTTKTTLKPAGVIAVRSDDVLLFHPVAPNTKITGTDFANLVASGKYDASFDITRGWPHIIMTAKPLDFGNLPDPVPASAYFEGRLDDCWGEQIHCATITDDTYRPRIYVNHTIWKSIFPRNFFCKLPVLNDPSVDASRLGDEPLEEASFPSPEHRMRRHEPLPTQRIIYHENTPTKVGTVADVTQAAESHGKSNRNLLRTAKELRPGGIFQISYPLSTTK
jgi:hypothetical protein